MQPKTILLVIGAAALISASLVGASAAATPNPDPPEDIQLTECPDIDTVVVSESVTTDDLRACIAENTENTIRQAAFDLWYNIQQVGDAFVPRE